MLKTIRRVCGKNFHFLTSTRPQTASNRIGILGAPFSRGQVRNQILYFYTI